MKNYVWLLLALLTAGCAVSTPPRVVPVQPPPAPIVLTVHTCAAGATVWLDGDRVPALQAVADANGVVTFPAFPSTITAMNIHATAPGYPTYGAVLTFTASTEPITIILGSCAK